MNWAELRDLVDALPEDSATKSAAAGDTEGRRWSQQTYLMATQTNLLQMAVRILWTAHLKGEPPDLKAVEPPQMESDEQRDELAAAREARNRALLESYRPRQDPDTAGKQAEVSHWMAKIRELEAAAPPQE